MTTTTTRTSSIATQVIDHASNVAADWRWNGRAISYTFVGGSIVKTYGVPVKSPALRGAIAWAMRRPGRQVEFSARSNRAIGFEQD